MPPVQLTSPTDLPPGAGYSHVAVVADARLVWTSGQVALDQEGALVGAQDIEAQTRQVMHNLEHALRAGGATWTDVIKLTIFLTDVSELAVVRRVRDEFIDTSRPPTSSLVQVAGLFRPDLLVEIEAVAAVSQHD